MEPVESGTQIQAEFLIDLGDIIADIARKKRNMGFESTRRLVHLFSGAAIFGLEVETGILSKPLEK